MVAVALASQREAPPRSCLSPTSISVLACWRPNVLGVSCADGPASLQQSGAAVAANDVRGTESRPATAVTPSRWRRGRQLGCRAEAGPHQLHTEVSRRVTPRLHVRLPRSQAVLRHLDARLCR